MNAPATKASPRWTPRMNPVSARLVLTSLVVAVAGFALLARTGEDITPAQPDIPSRKISLADFGAVADGKTSNSEVFRRAITEVEKAGGGVLVVPPGEYFTGPIELCSKIDLRLERGARLVFSDSLGDYRQDGEDVQPLIYSYYPFPLGAGLPKPPKPGRHVDAAPVTRRTPIWSRLTVRNLTATGASADAGLIMGLPEMPVSEVLLENVSITATNGLRIGYARNVSLRHVSVTTARGQPLLIEDTVEALDK